MFYWSTLGEAKNAHRHVITLLDQSDLCECGCRGRCSVNAVLTVISWSILQWRFPGFGKYLRRCVASLHSSVGNRAGSGTPTWLGVLYPEVHPILCLRLGIRFCLVLGVETAASLPKPIGASGGRRPLFAPTGFGEGNGRFDPRKQTKPDARF